MMLIMIYMMTSMFIVMTMLTLTLMISKKLIININKMSPFECGFNPMSKKRMPFSIHFFMVAIIFLIFDIEIIIILPSILVMKTTMLMYWMLSSMMFIIILILGLYYEWNMGLLNWQS